MCRFVKMCCFYLILILHITIIVAKFQFEYKHDAQKANENDALHGEAVRFRRNIPLHQYLDDHSLYGFEGTSSIPVNFPHDICIVRLESIEYAIALHPEIKKNVDSNNTTMLSIFQKDVNARDYNIVYTYASPMAIQMDCVALDNEAFVATATAHQDPGSTQAFTKGSPIFRLSNEGISIIQYVAMPHQNTVHLQRDGDDLFMFYTFNSYAGNTESLCPIYRLSGYHFDRIDELPCTNAIRIEPFVITSDVYNVVANYKDKHGNTDTFSDVYKLNLTTDKFYLLQKIRTNGVVDVKYFHLQIAGQREHFIVLANAFEKDANGNIGLDAHSIIYKLSNGYFVPFQSILLYSVKQFLPVLGPNGAFTLLISCNNQPTQAYQYDGWKFDDSNVQFTGGTLSKGVTNMRTYKMENATAVIVSNPMVITDAINVFVPIYTKRNDLKQKYEKFNNWCRVNCEKYLNVDVKGVLQNLNDAASVTKDNALSLEGSITLKSTNAQLLETKIFQTRSTSLNASLIELANKSLEKLQKRFQDITTARSSLGSELHLNKSHNQLAGDMHSQVITVQHNLTINKINGVSITNLVYTDRDVNLSELRTNDLILNAGITTSSHRVQPLSDQIVGATSKAIDIENLNVERLKVLGNINEINADNLLANALRISGDQFINAPLNVSNLQVKQIHPIDTISVEKMVRIDDGTFKVDQPVQFSNVLKTNSVNLTSRINHVQVIFGRLDVLMTDTPLEQIITGDIEFESAVLVEPIILQGKIQSHNLAKMNPISSIDDNLTLKGDFTIDGKVTINRHIIANNLYGSSETQNVQSLFEDGMRLDSSSTDVDLEFIQTINTEYLQVNAINEINPRGFLRYGDKEMQTIKGRKTFARSLHIVQGACEAREINKIDVQQLNSTVMKTNSPQTINGKIHFNKVTVERSVSNTTHINGAVLSSYWADWPHTQTVDKLTINGTVTVSGALNMNHLNSDELIFGQRFDQLLQSCASPHGDNVFLGTRSIAGEIVANKLTLKGQLWGHDTNYWNASLTNVGQEVVFNGSIQLVGKINVNQLTVNKQINAIHAKEFGKQWMLMETNQILSKDLWANDLVTEETLHFDGLVNKWNFNELVEQTLWINKPETLANVDFDHLVVHNEVTIDGLFSGINIPSDLVMKHFSREQELFGNLEIEENVSINGKLISPGWMDRLDRLCQYTNATRNNDRSVFIKGNIQMMGSILVELINGHPLNEIIANAWIANVPTSLPGHQFHQISTKSAQLTGNLNGIYLDRLRKYLLSKTKPQQIAGHLSCSAKVSMNTTLQSQILQVENDIKTLADSNSFNLNILRFNETVFKKDSEQIITGQWNIREIITSGDISGVSINNLIIKDDVVFINSKQNIVNSQTFVKQLYVDKLQCVDACKLQETDMMEWFQGSVPLYGNSSINGILYIDDASFMGDLSVQGLVNGIPFEAIVTKSQEQQISGTLHIKGNTKVQSITTDAVNGKNIKHLENVVVKPEDIVVNGSLRFNKPLHVEHLRVGNDVYGISIADLNLGAANNKVLNSYISRVNQITRLFDSVTSIGDIPYLKALEYRQTIAENVLAAAALEINYNDYTKNVLVVASKESPYGQVRFYTWNEKYCRFTIDPEMSSIKPINSEVYGMQILKILGSDFLIIETYEQNTDNFKQTFFPNVQATDTFFEYYSNRSRTFVPVNTNYSSSDCFLAIIDEATFIEIVCVIWNNGFHLKLVETIEIGRVSEITTISSLNNFDRIITLDGEKKVQIYSQLNELSRQTIDVHGALCVTSIEFKSEQYIAICSNNARHLDQHGSIEIYKATQTFSFVHVQTITVGSPSFAKFSVISSNELVLLIISNHPANRSSFFTLAGFRGLREFQEIPKASYTKSLNLIKYKHLQKEFIAAFSEDNMSLIEVVLN